MLERQSFGVLLASVYSEHAEHCEGLVLPLDNQATREKSCRVMTGYSKL